MAKPEAEVRAAHAECRDEVAVFDEATTRAALKDKRIARLEARATKPVE